jgi:phenylpropionate dioxygenase-like ring-hydroxylating dioxygenase large terminal subunit
VGHASEIPEPGDYRLSQIGRQSVIMTRDEAGQVHLLMNRCTHRANAVCQSERGNANAFRCAYHGWTFRNTGDLIGVTYPKRYGDTFNKADYGLRHVPRMGMYRGFMFGSLSPTGISLDDHLGDPVKAQLDLFIDLSPEGEIDVRAGTHKYGYNANWKFQYENSMDGYHPNFTHQTMVDAARKKMGTNVSELYTDDSSALSRDLGNGHSMLDRRPYSQQVGHAASRINATTPQQQEYRDLLEARYGKERAEEIIVSGGTHMAVFPNLILIASHIRVIQPVSADRTEIYLYPALLKGVPPEMNAYRLRAHEAFYGPGGSGAPDDLEMFERNQMGLKAQLDPWLLLSRGLGQEWRDTDGTLVGQMTDELPQRAFWRQWKSVLAEGALEQN